MHTPRPDILEAHYALIEGPSQVLGVRRQLVLGADGLEDHLELENTGPEPRTVTLKLTIGSDFADMFEARGWDSLGRTPTPLAEEGEAFALRYRARDGVALASVLHPSQTPTVTQGKLAFEFTLGLQREASAGRYGHAANARRRSSGDRLRDLAGGF